MSMVFSASSLGLVAVHSEPGPRSPLVWDGGYLKDPDTALLFKLNEGDGTLIHDASSFDNFGTITGAGWTDGKYSQGLLLDGINDFIQVPSSPSLALANVLTLEAWVFPLAELDGVGTIVVKPDSYIFEATEGANPKFRGGVWRAGAVSMVTSTSQLQSQLWQHLALTFDGTMLRLYLNGVLDAERTIGAGTIDTNAQDVFIGAHPTGTPSRVVTAILDEVRISSVVRAAAELDPNRVEP